MDPQARPCFFLNFGYSHGRKRLLQDHGRRDGNGYALAWRHIAPATGIVYLPGSDTRIVNVQPTTWCRNADLHLHPAATCRYCHTRRRACTRFGCRRTSAVTAPAPAPPLTPPAPIHDHRIVPKLGHEAGVRMPRCTRGETRATQDSHHSMGLMSISTMLGWRPNWQIARLLISPSESMGCRELISTSRLPPPAIYQRRQ